MKYLKLRNKQTGFLTALATLAGGFLAYKGAKDANKESAQSSARQMEFQERMSNTAHQREVVDLRAAGLNPILSGTGGMGASTPQGSQYKAENTKRELGQSLGQAAQNYWSAKSAQSNIDLQSQQGI